MSWNGKKVLVTGAAGFIGSHLTQRLVQLGATVTAFVRYNSRGEIGLLSLLPGDERQGLNVVSGDLKDPDAVDRAVRDQDVVMHLGALIGIPYSYVHPIDYVQTNIVGTANVLASCRRHNVKKLVHTSTSEVYGTARRVPIDEEHPLQGQSPYSASKIGADQMALSYHLSFDLQVAIIRPFNTYGPRQSSRAIIPMIISQALKGRDVRLGSLTPTRDLTFVADTVEGFIRGAEAAESVGHVTNIGSAFEISMGDLAKKIFSLMNVEPRLVCDEARVRPTGSEVNRLLASNEKARRLLNWSPKIDLDEGLRRTIQWVRENLSFYHVEAYHV